MAAEGSESAASATTTKPREILRNHAQTDIAPRFAPGLLQGTYRKQRLIRYPSIYHAQVPRGPPRKTRRFTHIIGNGFPNGA